VRWTEREGIRKVPVCSTGLQRAPGLAISRGEKQLQKENVRESYWTAQPENRDGKGRRMLTITHWKGLIKWFQQKGKVGYILCKWRQSCNMNMQFSVRLGVFMTAQCARLRWLRPLHLHQSACSRWLHACHAAAANKLCPLTTGPWPFDHPRRSSFRRDTLMCVAEPSADCFAKLLLPRWLSAWT